ncbi:MAG TPA: hypothetical protein VN495_00195 [Candidatus Paceibacterota bacterium]|nr:hypothetical protein [Candidatus Paceibacterota bacterium]
MPLSKMAWDEAQRELDREVPEQIQLGARLRNMRGNGRFAGTGFSRAGSAN